MAREVKFKLWHKETKQFLQIWPYNWLDGVYTNGTPNKYFDNKFEVTPDGMECNRIEGKSVFLTIDGTVIGLIPISDTVTKSLYYHDEYEILQFTGLHDCNGKEIYDGDVLSPMSKNNGPMIVYYEDAAFYCKHRFGKWGLLSRCFDADIQEYYSPSIIGSIYEHPELLNK